MKNKKTYVIAEVGVNHDGILSKAIRSIKAASFAGADAVKFQLFNTDEFLSDKKSNFKYKFRNKIISENMYKMFKRLEFKNTWLDKLLNECKKNKIDFLCSVADKNAFNLLYNKGIKNFKLSSEDLINDPLIKYISNHKDCKIILSTGMANYREIKFALNYFKNLNNISILHCVSVYPVELDQINLNRMLEIKKKFKLKTGFSDHSKGIIASIIASYLGAEIIEKHFTLNKNSKGPDHSFSLNPVEFKKMTNNIKNINKILGNKKISPSKEEKKYIKKYRRSVTAIKNINIGDKFSENNIAIKRPATGIHPEFFFKLVGKKSKKKYKINQKIKKI